ncbi:hypothetical protein GH714_030929 [Hevea brasiliensis]|uniref:Uncharacterized protein n=1 Tax=Hevea brasiliensis TaxID=3981 RepID=A0A6A6N566_HEVBR|nr:hypothetical protein GH714_030929 [Hevea brasiliensis]
MEKLVKWCSHFKELFPYEGLVDKKKHASSLAQIRYLELDLLPDLKYIWNQHSQLDQVLQNLETLKVKRCDNLISLAPSSASFQNLTNLDIENCSGLSSLVTCSAAKSLVQLTELSIKGCDGLTEIVANEGDESKKDIIFCKLKSLGIHCLPSLVCFCSAEHIFKFPSLMQVILWQCPKMQVFSKGILSTPRLRRIRLTEEVNDKGRWNGNLNTTIDQLFAEMELLHKNGECEVTFSCLKYLILHCAQGAYLLSRSLPHSLTYGIWPEQGFNSVTPAKIRNRDFDQAERRLRLNRGEWSWDDQASNGGITNWDGVKNKQAQKNLRAMRLDDLCFFYHSGASARRVVGVVSVVKECYKTADDEVVVDVKAVGEMRRPVDLKELKSNEGLKGLALFRQPRLSVVPISKEVWEIICELGGGFEGDGKVDDDDNEGEE